MNDETNQIVEGLVCKIICSLDLYTINDWDNQDHSEVRHFITQLVEPLCGYELTGIAAQWTVIINQRLIKHFSLKRRSK